MKKPENLKVGDMFRVIEEKGLFNAGEIISLKEDDGSVCPYFWKEDKSDYRGMFWSNLEPYPKSVRDAQVGDVVVIGEYGGEYLVLERGQNSVLLSCGNYFKKADGNYTFDQLEKYFTLKDAPVVDDNIVLSMDQIAEKFGIDASKLKIKKE